MSKRGEYRSIVRALVVGEDFKNLSTLARLAFLVLKLRFDVSGIEVIEPGEVVEALIPQTGGSRKQVRDALNEIAKAKWIEADGNVVWIVDQLKFDPHMSAINPLHRKAIQRHVDSLPHRPIVERWKAHYPEWIQPITDADIAETRAPKAPPPRKRSRATRKGIDTHTHSHSHHKTRQELDKNQEQQHAAAPVADATPPFTVIDGGLAEGDGKMTPAQRRTWLTPYGDVWRAEMGGEMAYGVAATVFKEIGAEHPPEEILEHLRRYCAAHQGVRASYASLPKFGQTYAQWGAGFVSAATRPGPALTPDRQALRDRYARKLEEASNG